MRRIGVVLALVVASIAAIVVLRPSAAARGLEGTRERPEPHPEAPEREANAALGTAVDAETGTPVAHARATLYRIPYELPTAEVIGTLVADSLGRFPIPLPEGCGLMVVEADGYPPQPVPLDAPGMRVAIERGEESPFQILDEEGQPAAYAEMDVFADHFFRVRLATARADAEGLVTVLVAGDVTLLVRFPGHAHEEERASAYEVRLKPGFVIAGKVADSKGRPVPGARVQLEQDAFPDYPPPVLAGPDGSFRFDGIHGTPCLVHVRAQGYCDVRWLHASPGDEDVHVVLMRPAAAAGSVVTESGAPVPGAHFPELSNPIETDAEGRFRLEGLDPERLTLLAESGDLCGSLEIEPAEGETVKNLRIVVRPKVCSRVRIRFSDERGRVVPDISVSDHDRAWDTTDEGGIATVTFEAPEGDVALYVSADEPLCGRWIETRSISPPREPPIVDVTLREGVLVRLDARAPDGTPIPDARATLGGYPKDEGWLVDPSEPHTATVWAPGFLETVIDGWTVASEGTTVRVTLRPCASVTGRVTGNATWFSIDPGLVPTLAEGDPDRCRFEVEPSGSFTLDGLEDGRGWFYLRGESGLPEAGVEITTRAGKVTDVGTLTLIRPATLRGRVVDSAGRPLGGARVAMIDVAGDTFSHADGTFRITVPAFLSRDLLVTKRGFGTVRHAVTAGPTRTIGDIAMPAPGALEVQVEGIDRTIRDDVQLEVAWPGNVVAVRREYAADDPDPYRIDDLAPGTYVVRVTFQQMSTQEEIKIAAGETAKVTFHLR